MMYTKKMIDLIQAARQRLPSGERSTIKLSNPNVLDDLQGVYQQSNDYVFKVLVKELLSLTNNSSRQGEGKAEAPTGMLKSDRKVTKPRRIYRGQVITG